MRNTAHCNHNDYEIIAKYAQIMQYIQECGYYNDKGINEWMKNDITDPWLIAAAYVKGYKLITFEQSAGSLNEKNKSGRIKILDIAEYFNVETYTLFDMMRNLEIVI